MHKYWQMGIDVGESYPAGRRGAKNAPPGPSADDDGISDIGSSFIWRITTGSNQHRRLSTTKALADRMKLLYPTSLVLDPSKISSAFPTLSLHPYDVKSPTIPEEHRDASILVTWTNSADNLSHAVKNLTQLKWIQSLAAGPNDVLSAGFDASKVKITTGSGLHDHTVAEHTLGLLLVAARRFHEMRDSQNQGKWPGHLGGPQPDRPKGSFRTLRDANVTVWGFGNIAKTLTPHLLGLGAKITGIARTEGIRNGIQVYGEDKLEQVLKGTDALVMILPGDQTTRHVLNKERLGWLPSHAWVVNVGRGTSVDEDALYEALEGGSIGGAALDVFETEPLPEGNKLYGAKNLVLSPHAAGGRPQGSEELIAENLTRFLKGEELKNII
ncbi:putative phosphoglycerate dehydrogenase [Cladorrhinum samala]|uniref:Phosphoglycerate dehydrogenase n=1 Tax=Cladorrhinum samala TaxID=585594 RepID=A0AAV9I177_9PEZI|nr:putative phosphoglycerate dehydrogenase [Cladorrhinum samala]